MAPMRPGKHWPEFSSVRGLLFASTFSMRVPTVVCSDDKDADNAFTVPFIASAPAALAFSAMPVCSFSTAACRTFTELERRVTLGARALPELALFKM